MMFVRTKYNPDKAKRLYWGIKGYNPSMSRIYKNILAYSISDEAKFRLEVINHFNKFGLDSTKQAFKISKASIYRWKQCLRINNNQQSSLIPKSRKPNRVRQMTTDLRLLEFISDLRKLHPRLGKRKIKVLLDKYAFSLGIKPLAVDTIGKVIKRNHLFYQKQGRRYHNPNSKHAQSKVNYKTKVKRSPSMINSGYIEIDTIALFVDGIKRYVYHALDVQNKFDFAYTYNKLNSFNTVDFFKKLEIIYPLSSGIKTVQTDNGLEFLGSFNCYLDQRQIKHLFIYPRCPKINGFIERSNRSLKEEFINDNIDLLITDLDLFNRKLIEHLVWYNTVRPHQTLNFMSPIDYLLKRYPESQMYTAHTRY